MASNSVAVQLNQILDEYEKEIQQDAAKAIESTAKETVKMLKSTSPKNTGEYAKSWTVKKDAKTKTYTVHNKKYMLTHLLENGHALRNGGRAPAQEHIAPAEKWASAEVVRKIEEELNR